jgi:hypothetical protein
MNLLRIQDALKNASDDQLMGLLRSPDATAPSYLVLSEIKRRKDMRAQQPQEPQGTVAEDLAKESTYDDQGIRSLKTPGYEEEAQQADDEGIQGMRRGGVVRMSNGSVVDTPSSSYSEEDEATLRRRLELIEAGRGVAGRVGDVLQNVRPYRPTENAPGVPPRPNRNQLLQLGLPSMSELEQQAIEAEREGRVTDVLAGQERSARAAEAASGREVDFRIQAMNDIRSRISSGTPAEQAIREVLPGYRGVSEAELRQGFGLPPLPAPASPPAAAAAADPGSAPVSTTMPPTVVTAAAPGTSSGPAAGAAGAAGAAPAAGAAGGAGRPGSAGGIGALGSGASPDFDRLYAANMARFPGLPADLQERLRSMRTKPGEERSKALNMSLIEAGLRMMASKNPSLLGSIGESAVPAVQSYAQQQAQIRKDQREDIKDELSVAQANLARAYYAGQITAAQYRTAVSELGANARAAAAEAGASARLASQQAGLESRERIAAARDASNLQRTADAAQAAALRNPELRNQMRLNLQMERTQSGNRTPVTENEVNEAIIGLGIRPGVAAPQGRIQDGRYIPSGS